MKHSETHTREIACTALMASATAILAQIQIPIGPIPFNLAVFGAFLSGMLLPPLWAAASMLVYMMLGAFGIPVFAGFKGGFAILFGKTGGYILGYFALAALTSFAVTYCRRRSFILFSMACGLVICYTFGTIWFMLISGADLLSALSWCVFPFILPDCAKAVGAFALGRALQQRMISDIR